MSSRQKPPDRSRNRNPAAQKRAQTQLDLTSRIQAITDRERPSSANPRQRKVYSVTQLVRAAGRQLEQRFDRVWVEGEVSNMRRPASGHIYLTLKDQQAQMPVVVFRSLATRLRFKIKDGAVLRVSGRLSIYEVQGRFQMSADQVELTGDGALQQAFDELKKKLAAEGIFDAKHKRPLPTFPRKIAIVTSRTGAALRDILRVLDARCPMHVILCPAMVQGREAALEICSALRVADHLGADVVIVGRGGGSLEDLWAFNDERVARTIFRMDTPVVSAVGHEIDLTISDLVADVRAATPSAAAELVAPVHRELIRSHGLLQARLRKALSSSLNRRRLALLTLNNRLRGPESRLNRSRMQLDDLSGRLDSLLQSRLQADRRRLDGLRLRLAEQHPKSQLQRGRHRLSALSERCRELGQRRLASRRAHLAECVASLSALSPLAILGRGYSVVTQADGQVIRDAQGVVVGDVVDVRLAHGRLACEVQDVNLDDAHGSD